VPGAFLLLPFQVSFFGLPVYTVAGTALTGTMITSFAWVLFFQIIAPFLPNPAVAPNRCLGILFDLGGFAGMYCGARPQNFVPSRQIKSIFAFCVFFTGTRYR